ncbi:MAG: glycosyltransferase family 4 protein [Thermoproteota archaeon]
MRILYIADIRGIGGLQNWALGVAEACKKRGHEVSIVFPPGVNDEEVAKAVATEIPVTSWKISSFQSADIVHSFDGRFNFELKRMMPKLPIVHTSSGASAAMFVALGRYLNFGWYLDLVRQRRGLLQEAAGSRYADWVIAASNKVMREISLYYRIPVSKITVIHGGHWKQEINTDKSELRRKLGLPEHQRLILFVGRPDPVKAFNSVLRSFQQLRSQRKDVVLVCAPPQGMDAEGVIGVELPWHQMPELYYACDMLVSASKYEGYSLAIHEAMAYGLPVIIPDTVGIVDLCVNGENAIVLPRWNRFEQRLLEAMTRLLEDESLRHRLGENARRTMQHRTWEWVAQETEKVYARALEKVK